MDNTDRVRKQPGEEPESRAAAEAAPALPVGDPARWMSVPTVLAMQRGYGNAHVSRFVGGASLARYAKPRGAGESVGAEPGEAEAMAAAPGERGELELGEKGYTLQMLKAVPEAAGKTFELYKDEHLEPVKVTFTKLDGETLPAISKKLREAKDKAGDFFNTPSTTATWNERAAEYQARLDQLVGDRSRAQQLVQDHNAGIPRANQMFVSLARLEAMQEMLGVNTPQALATAVVQSLEEAQEIGQRVQLNKGVKRITPPEAAEQVTEASKELTGAQKHLSAAWLGVQQNLVSDHAAELKKQGEDDEKRLAKINQHIATARKVGMAIDVSMAVMSGGATMVEGGGSNPLKPSELSDLLAEEAPGVRDRSGVAGAKQAGGAVAKGAGISIPSDASGLLETAAKIYYAFELEDIRKRLAELNQQVDAFRADAEEIGLAKRVRDFEVALERYEDKAEHLQKAMVDRQMAYLQLGEQLDTEARADPRARARGMAPGRGQERFATVMAVTAAAREVLAMSAGATAGFGLSSEQLGEELLAIARHRGGYGFPEEEDKPYGRMYVQQRGFEAFSGNVRTMLGPIDEKAGEVMTALSLGRTEAAEY
jgi:hypothetical protein